VAQPGSVKWEVSVDAYRCLKCDEWAPDRRLRDLQPSGGRQIAEGPVGISALVSSRSYAGHPSTVILSPVDLPQKPLLTGMHGFQVALGEGLIANRVAAHGAGFDRDNRLLDPVQLRFKRFSYSAGRIVGSQRAWRGSVCQGMVKTLKRSEKSAGEPGF